MVAETDPGTGREAGPAAEVPPVTAHALRHARLAAIHENGVASLLFSVALMLVCATLLLGSVDTGALGLWLAAGLGSVAVRLPFAVRARRLLATGAELPGTSTLVLSLGTAAVYGSLALFHEPGLPVVAQLALVLFPIAVTVGIVPAYGHWPAMFHAFAGVTLLPLLAVLLLSDAPAIRLLAVPVVLFLVGEALVVGRDAANAAERLRLRLGNEALVARLTERAADLEAARDAARQASAAKSEFLARMSHELRTPLNGVLGMSQLLAGSDLDDLQRRRLATLEASGRTLLELVDRLLDMARLQAHELVLEPRPIRLDALLERLVGDGGEERPRERHVDEPGREVDGRPGVDGGPVLLRLVGREELHGGASAGCEVGVGEGEGRGACGVVRVGPVAPPARDARRDGDAAERPLGVYPESVGVEAGGRPSGSPQRSNETSRSAPSTPTRSVTTTGSPSTARVYLARSSSTASHATSGWTRAVGHHTASPTSRPREDRATSAASPPSKTGTTPSAVTATPPSPRW